MEFMENREVSIREDVDIFQAELSVGNVFLEFIEDTSWECKINT